MDTIHTVLNRGCSLWDRERMPEQELRQRLEGVRAGMKERGLDLLLVYGDSWKFGHLAYISHFMPKNRGALAVVPVEAEPALVVQEPSRNNPFSTTLTWFDEVRSVGKFAQGFSEAVKARNLSPKKVGLVAVEEQLNYREWSELKKAFGDAQLSNYQDLFLSLRATKSATEIRLIQEVSGILEKSLSIFQREARTGQKEYELFALMEREARRRGVEDFRFLIGRSSQPEVGLRPATAAPIEKGEALLVTVAASYQRYWAELGQTFCLGRPSPEIEKGHSQAAEALGRVAAVINAPLSRAVTISGIKEAGLSAAAADSINAYGLGNGVGLDMVEEPLLREGETFVPREGMTLTLRICIHGRECASALIARPFRLTASGLQPLANLETGLISTGA